MWQKNFLLYLSRKRRISAMVRTILTLIVFLQMSYAQQFLVSDGQFHLNGKPFRIFSGEMHYPRIPQAYWRDRMVKAKAMGLNTICTYVFWNVHEPVPGKFTFEENLDIRKFIQTAHEEGLYVLLRPALTSARSGISVDCRPGF